MNINLSEEFTNYIKNCVESGYYQNGAEVIRDALRHMRRNEENRKQEKIPNKETLEAMAQLQNGGGHKAKNNKEFLKQLGLL